MADRLKKLEAIAKKDADKGKYLAIRRLTIYGTDDQVSVGILGPYNPPESWETEYFIEVRKPGKRNFVRADGDSFSAIGIAVSMSRLELWCLLRDFPQGLLDEDGALYENYDFTEAIEKPPINEHHPEHRKNRWKGKLIPGGPPAGDESV